MIQIGVLLKLGQVLRLLFLVLELAIFMSAISKSARILLAPN